MGLFGCAKFHLNCHRQGGNAAQKNIKNFHFLVKSKEYGRLLWPISKIFRDFYTRNYPTFAFRISCDSHHRLRIHCWETARPSIRPNFCVHPVGKTMLGIKKWMSLFDGHEELYHHAKLGKDRTMHAGCRCENVVFVCLFFLSRTESGVPCVRGVHSSNKHCVVVYCPISTRFTAIFHMWLFFQMHYIVLIFVTRWRHNEQVCAHQKSYRE